MGVQDQDQHREGTAQTDVRGEFADILDDLSQFLRHQKNLGSHAIAVSPESVAVIERWGTPGWRAPGFVCSGPEPAPLMVVDSQGTFFEGPAGGLLLKILSAMRLTQEKVFICHAANAGPIRDHVKRHDPASILCLGETAGRLVLNTRDTLTSMRGRFHTFENKPVMVTHHPAELLEHPNLKRLVWEDVQQVMARIGA